MFLVDAWQDSLQGHISGKRQGQQSEFGISLSETCGIGLSQPNTHSPVGNIIVNRRVRNAVLGCNLKNDRMISVRFQGKPFNITVIQVYAPTSKAKEEGFYEDLQDLLELTPKKDVLFMIGNWNAKVGSQETPGVTGKFGLGVQNEAGQRLKEFCQENALIIANTLFQQHKRRL